MELSVYKHTDTRHRLLERTPLVVVTRFNLFDEQFASRANDEGDQERIDLFRAHCLPAMLKQRVTPDAWYVLFDEQVRPGVADLIKQLEKYPWIRPRLVPRSYGMVGHRDYIREQLAVNFPEREALIICRLDSDDTVSIQYFNALEAAIAAHLKTADQPLPRITFFNFLYGVVREDDRFRVFISERSQFSCSYVPFDDGPIVTPCDFGHKSVARGGPVVEIATERPMWVYNIHDVNIGTFNPSRQLVGGSFADIAHLFGMGPDPVAKALSLAG